MRRGFKIPSPGEQKNALLHQQTVRHRLQLQCQWEAILTGGSEQDTKETQGASILAEATPHCLSLCSQQPSCSTHPGDKKYFNFATSLLFGSLLNPEPVAQLQKSKRTETMLKYCIKGTWRNENRNHTQPLRKKSHTTIQCPCKSNFSLCPISLNSLAMPVLSVAISALGGRPCQMSNTHKARASISLKIASYAAFWQCWELSSCSWK